MDKFSWRQYKMELTKRGYKVHIQENDKGKVYGYSIKRGNSNYKSSVLGIGRNLTPVSYTHLDVYKRQELSRGLKYLIIKQVKVWKKNSILTNYSKSPSP